MRELQALIVDDEVPARCELKCILENIPSVKITGECSNGREAIEFLRINSRVDIIFLDIEMPGMNGIETAKKINEMDIDARIVFSTGFDQFAIQAFELEVFDYVLKPYREERIADTIRRLQAGMDQMDRQRTAGEVIFPDQKFSVYSQDKIILLDPKEEIILVKTEKNTCTLFYTARGILESKMTLKDAEKALAPFGFCRTHKSYIMNLNKIKEIIPWFNDTYLLIPFQFEKEEVPVSRHYINTFKSLLRIR